ncbi:MAG: ribonuclease Z [Proteobacteria bacterium]|nr:ribonuclease Z [Pseudomonadota bacterium]
MEVLFLGTGTGVPSAERASPGLLVLAGGLKILVDAGSGTLRQLARTGHSYNDLDCIFLTHFHPDHTAELVPYLFATNYWPGFTRLQPARIYGPRGLLAWLEHLRAAWGHWVEPPDNRVEFHELELGASTAFRCGPLGVAAGPIPHTEASLGYRFSEPDGPTLVVTGDTDYGPGLVALARGADLLVTECSMPQGMKVDGHLTPELAGRAAREAGVGALALTHFYPETRGHDLEAHAAQEFEGRIILAEDLMRVPV